MSFGSNSLLRMGGMIFVISCFLTSLCFIIWQNVHWAWERERAKDRIRTDIDELLHPKIYYLESSGILANKSQEYLQETMANLVYENQKGERIKKKFSNRDFEEIHPNYPCLFGINVLGLPTVQSVVDGHKFSCGLTRARTQPIVYSFGTFLQQDFEMSILNIRPDAKIFVFELDATRMIPKEQQIASIEYYNIGLGYPDMMTHSNVMSFAQILKLLNHSHVDILKMDIEGTEWAFLEREKYLFEHIGQLLVELHVGDGYPAALSPQDFLNTMEAADMRLFHTELNFRAGPECCSEWSFIRKDWYNWNLKNYASIS